MLPMMTDTELIRLRTLWPDLLPGVQSPAELRSFADRLCARFQLAHVAIYQSKDGGTGKDPIVCVSAQELGHRTHARIERAIQLTAEQAGMAGESPWMLKCGEAGEMQTNCLLIGRHDRKEQPYLFVFAARAEITRQTAAELLAISHGIALNYLEANQAEAPKPGRDALQKLSQRELECLLWTAEGKTSEDIAIILQLSVHTINHYLTAATRKLNAVNRLHAVARAMRLGLLSASFGEGRDTGNRRQPAAAM
jgi:DNA-binding CsgD family transcriptional regulator